MTPTMLLARLSALGVRLSASGERLRTEAPKGVLTPDLLALLREHKEGLLAALRCPSRHGNPEPQAQNCGFRDVTPGNAPRNTGDVPDEWAEHHAERAAIMEHDAPDAHPTREAADRAAWADTVRVAGRRKLAELGWIVGDRLAGLPEELQGLVMPREGWTPASWAEHMRYLAGRCAELHPDRADLYRRASGMLVTEARRIERRGPA